MSEERHGSPSVLAANDVRAIISAWPALARRAALVSNGTGEPVHSTRMDFVPIDVVVIDVMTEVETWTNFLARTLLDEVPPDHGCRGACHGSAEHSCAGHPCGDGQPMVPAERCPMRRDPIYAASMPDLLAQVLQRIGHFAEHEDAQLALAFCDDAEHLRKIVENAARPTRRRWKEIGAHCFECSGVLRVLSDPDQPHVIPDVVCEKDRAHRIDPTEWQRAYRRTGDAQAAVDVVARWRRETREESA